MKAGARAPEDSGARALVRSPEDEYGPNRVKPPGNGNPSFRTLD